MKNRYWIIILFVSMFCLTTACKSKKESNHVQELVGYYEMNRVEVDGSGSRELERGYAGTGSLDIISFADDNKISVRGSTMIEGQRYTYTVNASVSSDGVIIFDPIEWGAPNWLKPFGKWYVHMNIIPRNSSMKLTNNILSGAVDFEAYDLDRDWYYFGRVIASGYKVY